MPYLDMAEVCVLVLFSVVSQPGDTSKWGIVKADGELHCCSPSSCLKSQETSPSEAESLKEEVGGVEKGGTL